MRNYGVIGVHLPMEREEFPASMRGGFICRNICFVLRAYPEIAFIRTGIQREAEGFTQWKELQSIQSAMLTTRTFDYKRPDLPEKVRADIDRLNRGEHCSVAQPNTKSR
ncbi:MAG: hypothetical protein KGQ57_00305 [Burkholderiales bacterium]|nr:hypothetical protein [Burkholderiales bacterium]